MALTGCGTLVNLNDAPTGPMMFGTGVCYPFGGTMRSGMLAGLGTPVGIAGVVAGPVTLARGEFQEGFKEIGTSAGLATCGLVAIADVPLSFVGDVVTLPIVLARTREHPWATWWGEKARPMSPWSLPDADEATDPSDPGCDMSACEEHDPDR